MNYSELDNYFKSFLPIADFAKADPSKNGVQVQNDGSKITTIAFAVDACLQTIEQAAQAGAQMLFVHHGLFWGHEQTITDSFYKRIKALVDNNIALYACHLPLDAHPEFGNNAQLAKRIALQNILPFGEYHGMDIGFMGELQESLSIDDLLVRLFPDGEKPISVLPFGNKEIKTVALVSGGGASDLGEAISKQVDVFITGEIGHAEYHVALEAGINVVAGGHYQTETVGVQAIAKKIMEETDIKTVFIPVPTGL